MRWEIWYDVNGEEKTVSVNFFPYKVFVMLVVIISEHDNCLRFSVERLCELNIHDFVKYWECITNTRVLRQCRDTLFYHVIFANPRATS